MGGAYKGKKAISGVFEKLGALGLEGVEWNYKNIVEAGDTVLAEGTVKFKLAGGKDSEVRTASVFEFRGGKVINMRSYGDTEAIARAMGKL